MSPNGGRTRIALAGALGLTLLASVAPVSARPPRWSQEAEERLLHDAPWMPDAPGGPRPIRQWTGFFHDVGQLLLHVTNLGFVGLFGAEDGGPSAEWPAGSGIEYLFAAGPWIGSYVEGDTLVSGSVYNWWEMVPWSQSDQRARIYESSEGTSGGSTGDDDGDGRRDEDRLDGVDNDGDGRIDEDYLAVGQQMFSRVYYDTSTFYNERVTNTLALHVPIGVEVHEETYAWTGERFDDFIGIEYKVKNITDQVENIPVRNLENVYVGFMVDGDIGPKRSEDYWTDDQACFVEIDTTIQVPDPNNPAVSVSKDMTLTLGYVYDSPGGTDGDRATGYLGVMFLGHNVDTVTTNADSAFAPPEVRIHAFKQWTGSGEDPNQVGDLRQVPHDRIRYEYMRGNSDRFDQPTIDDCTIREQDYRLLVSAGPFARVRPGSTLVFRAAFVVGEGLPGMIENAINAQRTFEGTTTSSSVPVSERRNWVTSSPPPPPNQRVTPFSRRVVVEWDDFPETVPDPLTEQFDFAGYRVWRAVSWRREAALPADHQWELIAEIDTTHLYTVYTGRTGIGKYMYVDSNVHDGFPYWYAVTAFDNGKGQSEPLYGKFSQAATLVFPRPIPQTGLDHVRVVPNPYREPAPWDLAETATDFSGRRIRFMNLPQRATIRIYTLAGDLVQTLEHDAAEDEESVYWDLLSRNNQEVVAGLYLYHIDSPEGSTTGKLAIIR